VTTRFLQRHKITLTSIVLIVILAMALVVYAASTDGYPVRHVDLNDGGIWVTSSADALFGRLNKPAGSIDAALTPVAADAAVESTLDVRQAGAAVVAWDEGLGKLYPVDVLKASIAKDHAAQVSSNDEVGLAGGSLAALDPSTGKLWAQRVDPDAGVSQISALDSGAKPIARVELTSSKSPPSLAVARDGTVYAVSSAGRVTKLAPSGSGFARPTTSKIDASLESAQATAIGNELVVLDAAVGTLVLPGGKTVKLDVDDSTRLQAPSDSGSSVVIATKKALVAIDLGSGARTVLWDNADGTPAQPTWLDGCVYAAWTGSPGQYVHSCDGRPAIAGSLKDDQALVQPVFRVNRDSIVLNDLSTGLVIDLQSGRQVDNWKAVKPPPISDQQNDEQNQNPNPNQQDLPPKAVDDTLGARAGRTTVLHVLDNDSDPQGYILAVSAVAAADDPNVKLSISPDGQTVQATLPSDSQGAHFKYTVDDGKGLSATANVTVEVHQPDQNEPPNVRVGFQPQTWNVAAGGTLSLPVLGDWRDADGDPPVLTDATVPSGTITTTSDGRVSFTAGLAAGPVTIAYHVSDGVAGATPAEGSISAVVLDPTSTSTSPATAEPDIARGVVGQPILIRPLDNDLPGTDPANPAATLAIAGQITSPEGTEVVTDVKSGLVTLTAGRPGSFALTYQAAFGNAAFSSPQTIRVDVAAAPDTAQPPVAMPDNSVLRGQAPNLVDVLANDFDPAGRLLAVTHAEAAADNGQLQVAIVQGHWLRINALTPALNPNPQVLRYTITDGVASATGEVTATQFPALERDAPVPQDDFVTVRAGDVVSVPVLDNDSNPGGDPISLVSVIPGFDPVGALQVNPVSASQKDVGAAYVSGSLVRYVPPATVDSQQSVIVDYVEQDPAGDQATGHLHVAIMPAPTADNPDLPPTPQGIEARVTAGDRITIAIPTYGVDPDGDSVSVTGVASATSLGRIISVGATSMTYEAFPTSAGTDTFGYRVVDGFGKSGEGTVRIAVVPPGDPQAPVAVDDQVTAAPGARLQLDVLANDITVPNDHLTISPGGSADAKFPDGVSLATPTGPLRVTAPDANGKPLVVVYSLSDGIGTPSTAKVTVRAQAGYNNPPRAFDVTAHAKQGTKAARVNVLAKAYDPDGRTLKVTPPAGAKARGGVVTVKLDNRARNLPYRIVDSKGATAAAVIHVPSTGDGAPYAKPGAVINVDKDSRTTVAVADYVTDPAGKDVRLTTTDKISGAPAGNVKLANDGEDKLDLTTSGGYVGPAAANFEVTNGASLKDATAQLGYINVPVQVGPETPVVRCPTDPIPVVEGGQPVVIDVASVCHVWVADPGQLPDLKFDASWSKKAGGVSIDGGGSHTLTLTASGSATPGDVGQMSVGIAGGSSESSTLSVQVVAAPPPTITPVVIDGFKVGTTAKLDLADYVQSRLRDPKINVVSVDQVGGDQAQATKAGSTVSITPGAKSSGVLNFSVIVSDVDDSSRADRHASGSITMNVLNVPDAPTNVAPGRTVLSHVVELSWTSPKNNGAPIDSYTVQSDGVSQQCAASPCTITNLTNGQTYSFTVKAHNLVGDSEASAPSAGARPDAVPDAVTGLRVSNPQDGTVTLSWSPAHGDGTPVNAYRVAWPGGSAQVGGSSTQANPSGLNNDSNYTFTVIAVNEQGPGAPSTAQGQSAGKPATPGAPSFTATNDTSGNNKKIVVLSWTPVDPNGIAPTSYVIQRDGSNLPCGSDTATTCTDPNVVLDGSHHSYTITAKNAAATTDAASHSSAPGPATTVEATATPDPINNISTNVSASTPDGQVPARFDLGASHGASSTVQCSYSGGSCGQQQFGTSAQSGATMTLSFSAGYNGAFTLTDCNGSSQSDAFAGSACGNAAPSSVAANGPPNPPVGGVCAGDDGNNATFAWSAPGNVGARAVTSYRYTGAITGSTAATSVSMGVAKDGAVRTINVYSVDSQGEQSAGFISISCHDPAPPPPPASITASRGAAIGAGAGPAGCTSGCYWINFTLSSGFPGGSYTWTCSGSPAFGPKLFSAGTTYIGNDSNGRYCAVGSGSSVAITINGITSNAVFG
jgi:hypothetical protein